MNMKQHQKIGDFILWSQGGWSDCDWKSLFRVIKDFELSEKTEEWVRYIGFDLNCVNLNSDKEFTILNKYMDSMRYREYENCIEFFPYLVREGYLEDVDMQECHTGEYDDFILTIGVQG